jgi:hypothetical protein
MLLLSLVGEQPIPNLLASRYLKPEHDLLVYTRHTASVASRLRRALSGDEDLSGDLLTDAYDFPCITADLHQRLEGEARIIFNLTGGTKIMALAAFKLAQERAHPFVYVQSEGRKSLLYRYEFKDGQPVLTPLERLPELITATDYLNAHLPGFRVEGFSCDENGNLTEGGRFEKAVYHALEGRMDEILAGVRPEGVANQIEIDLVLRCGNQVGIAEIKLGGGESGKRGLDQLKMAGEPGYLGTYTAQFMITARQRLSPSIETLARERRVHLIYLPEYQAGKALPLHTAERLGGEIRQRLCDIS